MPVNTDRDTPKENSMSRLRQPKPNHNLIPPFPPPAIDEEIIRYHEERLKRLRVVATTRTPSGQILDWVPIESQDLHGRIATPPPTQQHRTKVASVTSMAATFEMQELRIERGPEGTVPLLRRRFALTKKLRNAARKRKVDGRRLQAHCGSTVPDVPPDPGYYHGTMGQSATCYGCEAVLAVWDPWCELAGDHSISQFGIQNYDNPQLQSLEADWITSVQQFGDDLLHFFIYYTTNGYASDGDNLGGYDTDYAGWVQYDSNIYPGAVINAVDFPGIPSYELEIKYQLWQGNWWFQMQGTWIGYYPASLFGSQPGKTLSDHAEWCGFWGEVYSALSDKSQTTTSMGSGQHVRYGFPWAAYQRNMQIQTDAAGTMANSLGSLSAENSAMYDIQFGALPFNNWIFVGGSGIGTPHIIVYPWP
jgi:Neprosin